MARARAAKPAAPAPLPPRLVLLVREAWWIVFAGVGAYLALILTTFRKSDPGWSHAATESTVGNAGGALGAWVADLLLYMLGLSAWWLVVLCLLAVHWMYRRLETGRPEDRRPAYIALGGFVLLLIASSGFETMRLHSVGVALPYVPGGMLGEIIANALQASVGFVGGTLLLIVAITVGLSLFTGISWLAVSERIGHGLERVWNLVAARLEERRDRRLGEEAAIQREEVVEVTRERLDVDVREPIRIEPPVMEIPKSKRVAKEKQKPLFHDLPDSPLPPLELLDDPPENIEVLSAYTLDYTSRLIEKKLMDFGIEVKVLAAYPGPVITRYEIEPATGVKGSQIVNLVRTSHGRFR